MIRIKDLAWVRYRVPDLDLVASFLLDFGLKVHTRTDNVLYMRGADSSPYLYVAERHDVTGFVGPTFEVDTAADLAVVARMPGATPIEAIDAPGGGKRVRILDPDGYQIEFAHGVTQEAELEIRPPMIYNVGPKRQRVGEFQRPPFGPAHVHRIGHLILRVSDYARSLAFYSKFGFLVSDEVHAPDNPEQVNVGFLKCDRGEDFTDHHTLGLALRRPLTVDHVAFECIDIDDVVLGGQYLLAKGYTRAWGVGRHILGSQIFDYWRDPYGFKLEHWTDGDLVNNDTPSTRVPAGDEGPGAISQWGNMPEEYLKAYPQTLSIGPLRD